jgi:hypothetical protein
LVKSRPLIARGTNGCDAEFFELQDEEIVIKPRAKSSMDSVEARLKQLAAFAPAFRDPATVFGKWHGATGKGTPAEPMTMPWFEMSEVAARFCDVVNDFSLNLDGFDWPRWVKSREGRQLTTNLSAVAAADGVQLAKLALALVRQDRFVEGALAKAYEDKVLLAIVERADA